MEADISMDPPHRHKLGEEGELGYVGISVAIYKIRVKLCSASVSL